LDEAAARHLLLGAPPEAPEPRRTTVSLGPAFRSALWCHDIIGLFSEGEDLFRWIAAGGDTMAATRAVSIARGYAL